jgi:hypothetical protein
METDASNMNDKAANDRKDELPIQNSESPAQSSKSVGESKHSNSTAPTKTANPYRPEAVPQHIGKGFIGKNKPGKMWDGTEEEWKEIEEEVKARFGGGKLERS